jgi:benzoyl-CoA 2,3-epoxidase subunit B
MPNYRWGIFLAPPEHDRRVGFGDHLGLPVWQEVPGEYRNMLRRLIVTQGDTEPASVEQQRLLGQSAPSLYDLRNLFQVNVEEGRHLWAMVYLLHSYFGRDGREESEELLERRSGSGDKPRILEAFNEPIEDWLSFYMFTTFTDRDGKYQLLALAESGFDPLSRTTRFMLTEEAHHMFVGESGVRRVVRRACETDARNRRRRRPPPGRHRSAHHPEVHQPVVQPEPRSVRRRSIQQCRQLFQLRDEGPRARSPNIRITWRSKARMRSPAKRSRCATP